MNTQSLSFKRYWEPSYFQTATLSLTAGAIASFVTYPAEFIKTSIQYQAIGIGLRGRRGQTQGYNPFRIFRQLHGTGNGLNVFYQGFDAHLYGRMAYLAVRNTLYTIIYNTFKPTKPYNDMTYREKSLIGAIAGAAGAVVSHPFTVLSIRQILDTQTKLEWRRNYSEGVFEAINQLKTAGQTWNGLKVNVIRHVFYNLSLTGPYDYFKEGLFTRFGQYGFVEPLAMLFATAISALVTLPVDNLRTRMCQLHKQTSRNRLNFSSIVEGLSKSLKVEGHYFALWSGMFTFFPQLFVYAYLTVGITNAFTESWKRKQGLLEWQI